VAVIEPRSSGRLPSANKETKSLGTMTESDGGIRSLVTHKSNHQHSRSFVVVKQKGVVFSFSNEKGGFLLHFPLFFSLG